MRTSLAEVTGFGIAPDLAGRLNRLRSQAQGRVLEIGAGVDVENAFGLYDSLVVHDIVGTATDPGPVIEHMIDLLAEPDGILWFLEPTAGARGSGGEIDVPRELRRRGLFVTDLERFVLDHGPRDRRIWAEGCARRSRRSEAIVSVTAPRS